MSRSGPWLLGLVVGLTLTFGVGCGGEKPAQKRAPLPVVTVWSSMPFHGPQREQSLAYDRVIRGAVYDLRGLERGYRVSYKSLDDSSKAADGWDPAVVATNARQASLAASTMAYIGEADSGATAVALPILNQSGILQLSATSTAEGLTRAGVGAGPGAPYQYYPSGNRTFGRMVPHDSWQGAVIAALVKSSHCSSVAILDDGTIYGAGLSAIVSDEVAARRVRIAFSGTLDPAAAGYGDSVRGIKSSCIVYSGDPGTGAVKVVTDAARHNHKAKVFVPDALVDPSFTDHSKGGIGPRLGNRVTFVGAFRPPVKYPPFGRKLFDQVGGGTNNVRAPNVAAVYAAAELALRCINRVQAATGFGATKVNESRRLMVNCALGRGHRSVALGSYRIHADGDWNGRSYSQLRVREGKLVFVKELKPPPLFAAPRPVVNPTG